MGRADEAGVTHSDRVDEGDGPARRRGGLWRRMLGWLAAGALLFLGYAGVRNGFGAWDQADTGLKRVATVFEIAYGVLGLVAFALVIARLRAARHVLYLWVLVIALTGGLAAVGWGGAGIWMGVTAALVTAPVAGLIAWLAFRWSSGRA